MCLHPELIPTVPEATANPHSAVWRAIEIIRNVG
jgi:hypothetical protein